MGHVKKSEQVALKLSSIKYRKPHQSNGGSGDKDGRKQDSTETKATEEVQTLYNLPAS